MAEQTEYQSHSDESFGCFESGAGKRSGKRQLWTELEVDALRAYMRQWKDTPTLAPGDDQ